MALIMTEGEAFDEVARNWEYFLQSWGVATAPKMVGGRHTYICPVCGNGSGSDGDGMMVDPKSGEQHPRLSCFKGGCSFKHGDIIDLYMEMHSMNRDEPSQRSEAGRRLAEEKGIEIKPYAQDTSKNASERPQEPSEAAGGEIHVEGLKNLKKAENGAETASWDFTSYYARCEKNLKNPAAASYLRSRGISMRTAQRHHLGFDPQYKNPNALLSAAHDGRDTSRWTGGPYLIIPVSSEYYDARRVDGLDYMPKAKGGAASDKVSLFNGSYIDGSNEQRTVFVVEAALDALSFEEVGKYAVALDSTANRHFNERLRNAQVPPHIILALDNDEPDKNTGRRSGAEGMKALAADIMKMNEGRDEAHRIRFRTADVAKLYLGCKDANDALQKDRKAFSQAVEHEILQLEDAAPDNTLEYIDNMMTRDIEKMKRSVKMTGFENLDKASGGLRAGLYILAATSSLGKSTFAHQLSENLAASGSHVLFFSLEMSRLQMVSKSLSRGTAMMNMSKAVSSSDIAVGRMTPEVIAASDAYKEKTGRRLSIIEADFGTNVQAVQRKVMNYISFTGRVPTIVIDYLQIMGPVDGSKAKDKRGEVDETITALKLLSKDLNTTVIAISNVNRSAYNSPMDFESLKESGGIEFSADCVWALEYQCMSDDLFEADKKTVEKRQKIDEARDETPRRITMKSLKNRFGNMRYEVYFEYYCAYDLFVIDKESEEKAAEKRRQWAKDHAAQHDAENAFKEA